MSLAINILVFLTTIVAMEMLATVMHKYVLHGIGWSLHQSHHEPHDHTFERNDLYAVFFAVLSFACFALGSPDLRWLWTIGAGMSAYGMLYFLVHDGLSHQRWPFRYMPKSGYLKRLVQAHRLHHASDSRERAVSYGFLYAPPVGQLRRELQSMQGPEQRGRAKRQARAELESALSSR